MLKQVVASKHAEIVRLVEPGTLVQFLPQGKLRLSGDFDSSVLRAMASALDEVAQASEAAGKAATATASAVLASGR